MSCAVTYLQHSGFSVRTDAHQLLFDCIGGPVRRETGVPCVALVSHAHGDHFRAEYAALGDAIVLGEGIEPLPGSVVLRPGESVECLGAEISAFGSTDCGVSFLVRSGGLSVFHAGDLNYWHWREVSSEAEVGEALDAFDAVLDTLAGIPVDLAFFPVDARMGRGYDEGADMYIRRVHPQALVPMHWWDRPEVARAYAQKHAGRATRVIALTRPGESCYLT